MTAKFLLWKQLARKNAANKEIKVIETTKEAIKANTIGKINPANISPVKPPDRTVGNWSLD